MYFKGWLEENKPELCFLGEELTWDSGEEVKVVRRHKKRTEKKENEKREVLTAIIPHKIKTGNIKEVITVNTYSNNKYWFRCSKCGFIFQSTPKVICYPKKENTNCRYCDNRKDKDKKKEFYYPTLKNWESESDIKVVGELVKDKDKYIINPVKNDIISIGSRRKLVFRCKLHDRYEELTIRVVCLGNRRKKVDNYKYQMECCRPGFTLFEWCLLFYYYEFNDKIHLYNGRLVLEHYNLVNKLQYSIEKTPLLTGRNLLFGCSQSRWQWARIDEEAKIENDNVFEEIVRYFMLSIRNVTCGKHWCNCKNCDKCTESVEKDSKRKIENLNKLAVLLKKNLTELDITPTYINQVEDIISKKIENNKRLQRLINDFVYYKSITTKNIHKNKIRNKEFISIIREVNKYFQHEDYTRFVILGKEFYALIPFEITDVSDKNSYYLVTYNKITNGITGIFISLDKSFLSKTLDTTAKNGITIHCLLKNDLKKINFVVDMKSNPKYMGNKFTKLKGDGLRIEYKNAYIPENITEIDADFFDTCKFTGKLTIPKSLLPKLVEVGFKESSGVNIDFIPNSTKMTLKSQRGSNYTEFLNLFQKDEILRIYEDMLTLVDKRGNEREYINNFKWKKFYNSEKELATCLMLSWFGIVTATDMTGGLVDIYRKKRSQ